MKITEGVLSFNFEIDNGSLASQYDEWSFYRNQFINVAIGTKAVDFIYINKPQKTCWLIEVKDYRHPDAVKIKPSELAEAVALKVRDTLAGLVAAKFNATDQEEINLAALALQAKNIKVVLHMEQHKIKNRYIDPADILQKLKQKLKSIDTHPYVVHKDNLKNNMHWQVS